MIAPIRPVDPAKLLERLEWDIGFERESARATKVAIYFLAGECLQRIRDEELYRVRGHNTFGAYARKRWHMSLKDVDRLIEHCEQWRECAEGAQRRMGMKAKPKPVDD